MKTAEYYIEELEMLPHVEGGYFKESFLSEHSYNSEKKLWISIYFLLRTGQLSNFHRLKSDELWYYHAGESLTIYMITPKGELITKQLGINIENGDSPQVLVPKGYIFGSAMDNDGFSLVGCMVSPAFTYDDFELFKRDDLLNLYPEHKSIINRLTRD